MPEPTPWVKLLVIGGVALLVLAGLVWFAQYLPENLRPFRLPGDIRIERDGFRFYLPITSMILLSLVATGLAWVVRWWQG
jgi:hypothetical protein